MNRSIVFIIFSLILAIVILAFAGFGDNALAIEQARAQIETAKAAQAASHSASIASSGTIVLVIIFGLILSIGAFILFRYTARMEQERKELQLQIMQLQSSGRNQSAGNFKNPTAQINALLQIKMLEMLSQHQREPVSQLLPGDDYDE